ncbi:MAG TPA: peptidoglycan bridge formation glycyltransferase FemA/FemB family protein [Candidatus Dormibacteraeota bacterium]|nr:peptidoglycan bridge formation glycyltransferase FemA/FemB family protein [Candidatus Dormibacteraeota bacterium]
MSADSERWDAQLAERAGNASPPPLLQSWAWGEVQARAGWTVERVRLSQGVMASVQLRNVGPARDAYVPRGPVPATVEAVDALASWAKNSGISRLVVEPEAPAELGDALMEKGFERVVATQPRHTRILKLLPPEQLLATFKHGRRYNIRTGMKRGVVVEEGKDAKELARQSAAVERRESIRLPERRYYQLLLDLLPWCRTYTARAPDRREPLASVLVARHGGRAYSLFAGRTGAHRELMGNDLAWWSAISAAAEAGCTDFDLWGVPPPRTGPEHPWHGLGFFKSEFGGEEIAYTGAWEIVLSASGARLLDLERKARAYIRGLKRNIP